MTIKKEGSKHVLKSKKTGKTLGKHSTRAEAVKQERAIHASKTKRKR